MIITFFPTLGLSVGLEYLPAEDELRPELVLYLLIIKLSITWQ
jgi:hypothetical protein